MKHIYFTVTNDLSHDQRMHRICSSLALAGFRVTLVGRKLKSSKELKKQPFFQKRISCFFNKGFLFYSEYNIRLFFFLLGKKMDGVCSIDLDTILPCLFVSRLKGVKRIYDAHEYFTGMKEVISRKNIQKIWTAVERFAIPKFHYCYTVGPGLAAVFEKKYNHPFHVIRNLPVLRPLDNTIKKEKFLYYGGAVNEARGFEFLIPAMRSIPYQLIISGDGNFMNKLKELVRENEVEDKIVLQGMVTPSELYLMGQKATLGLNLVEKDGLNQYYSLANKFFEYIQAGLPQLSMNFPEYRTVNDEYQVAWLIDDLSVEILVEKINEMMDREQELERLHLNALKARLELNWENEERKLVELYRKIFQD